MFTPGRPPLLGGRLGEMSNFGKTSTWLTGQTKCSGCGDEFRTFKGLQYHRSLEFVWDYDHPCYETCFLPDLSPTSDDDGHDTNGGDVYGDAIRANVAAIRANVAAAISKSNLQLLPRLTASTPLRKITKDQLWCTQCKIRFASARSFRRHASTAL